MGIEYSKAPDTSNKGDTNDSLNVSNKYMALELSIDILRYENETLRRELSEKSNEVSKLRKKLKEHGRSKTNSLHNIRDFIDLEIETENIDTLRKKCEFLQEVVNYQNKNMELVQDNLHNIIRNKYIECEELRQQVNTLKSKLELLTRIVQRMRLGTLTENHKARRIIEVLGTCNSSNISMPLAISSSGPREWPVREWDADGCVRIPLKDSTTFSDMTLKETEICNELIRES